MMTRSSRCIFLSILGLVAMSCGEPVRDQQIAALGGEDPNVPQGPDHRPGQPCVLCHSDGGPASKSPFAVGGTIYISQTAGSAGAAGVQLKFVDAANGEPIPNITTSASGNFYVRTSEWPSSPSRSRSGSTTRGAARRPR